jgi:predicted DNA-binding protein YlxM (UPF0122 family)
MVRIIELVSQTQLCMKKQSFYFLDFSMQLIMGEEVALSKLTLMECINKICDGVQARADLGLYSPLVVLFAK